MPALHLRPVLLDAVWYPEAGTFPRVVYDLGEPGQELLSPLLTSGFVMPASMLLPATESPG